MAVYRGGHVSYPTRAGRHAHATVPVVAAAGGATARLLEDGAARNLEDGTARTLEA